MIVPVDAQLSLDVSVPEQRCSSCYLGRLWPQKYLVSSHSVKWNWLFIGFPLYGCHQRRLFPSSLFSACQFPPHSYRQPLALIDTNHCVTAHARLLWFASIRPFFQQVVSYLRQWLEINTYFYFRLIHFRWISRRLCTPSLRQAEIGESRSTHCMLEILGDLSSSPLFFFFPLYFVSATYKQDTRTPDAENDTSENVSAIHPSILLMRCIRDCRKPRLLRRQHCCWATKHPSGCPRTKLTMSCNPGPLTASGGGPWIHPYPCFRLTCEIYQELILQNRLLFRNWLQCVGLVRLINMYTVAKEHTRLADIHFFSQHFLH